MLLSPITKSVITRTYRAMQWCFFFILGALQCKICPAGTYQNSTGYPIHAPACKLRRIPFLRTCLHTILLIHPVVARILLRRCISWTALWSTQIDKSAVTVVIIIPGRHQSVSLLAAISKCMPLRCGQMLTASMSSKESWQPLWHYLFFF